MAKLHELLAVHKSLEGQGTQTRLQLMGTFEKRRHHFEETRKTFISDDENTSPVIEEQKDIQTTVVDEVKWISDKISKAIDIGYQIDVANSSAKSDVIVDGQTTPLLKGVPATALLQLEKRLGEVRAMIAIIPTLDPTKGFATDSDRGKNIFRAREVVKPRTKKTQKVLTLAPATDKHPAQAQLVPEDVRIGVIKEQEWSSLITPATKSDLMERVEILTRAVQRARSKANEQELDVSVHKIGATLLEYIFQPLDEKSA